MIYISRPHTVEAFNFITDQSAYPKWFVDAVHAGRASVTLHPKGSYITLYTKEGNVERARPGDWVCMNGCGKLFTITDDEFRKSYYLS